MLLQKARILVHYKNVHLYLLSENEREGERESENGERKRERIQNTEILFNIERERVFPNKNIV